MISHRQRLEDCLDGKLPDRTPVALWRHFPVDDQTPGGLASATINYQKTFDFDLVKVTPASSFCLKDWGARDEWQGASEGTRTYTHRVIQDPDDWTRLKMLDPNSGFLGEQLTALGMITKELGNHTPVLQTIFSPMAQAKNLVGGTQLLIHLRKYPQELHQGLSIIAESTRRFLEAANRTGIAGVFYAVQHAQYGLLSQAEFLEFGRFYDLQVLQANENLWLNMLHLHGEEIMFETAGEYPVEAINWHDRDTFPSLEEAINLFPGVLVGGLQREDHIVLGKPESVIEESHRAIRAMHGKHFILGTGCVVPVIAPSVNIWAARKSVESFHIG